MASQQSFLDQQFDKDGKPYAPKRFKELVSERFYISQMANNISYAETGKLVPAERKIIIDLIKEVNQAREQALKDSRKGSKK